MFKNIRTTSLAIAITLACTSAAIAFPPCPLDETQLIPLGHTPASSTSSWSSSIYSHAGSIAPIRIKVPCQPNFPEVTAGEPRTGQCDEDVLILGDLPARASAGTLDLPLGYSPHGWVGYLGLPELRMPESVDGQYEYAFTLAVNTTRLAYPGDWLDIAEMTLIGPDETQPPTTYRLRKIQTGSGTAELQLITSTVSHASDTPVRAIVAVVPLDKNIEFQDVALRWTTFSRTRNPPPLSPKPVILPPSEYVVDTQLTVTAGKHVIHSDLLQDRMPDDMSIGILDYNLPHALAQGRSAGKDGATLATGSRNAQAGSTTTSSTPPPIPGMNDPGRALVFPKATLSSRRI